MRDAVNAAHATSRSAGPIRRPGGGIAYLLARFPPFDTIELGIWETDTWLQGLALVPLGLVLLVVAGWLSEAMAAVSHGLARWGAK